MNGESKMWHAYASQVSLSRGTSLLVTGGIEPIGLGAGEMLLVELPDGEQLKATILSCQGGLLVLLTSRGALIELHRVSDDEDFASFKLSDGFSRQVWAVH